jgi:hypothetical protein
MTQPRPIVTPGSTVTRAPSQHPSSTTIGSPIVVPARCSESPISWVLVSSATSCARNTFEPMVIGALTLNRQSVFTKLPGPMVRDRPARIVTCDSKPRPSLTGTPASRSRRGRNARGQILAPMMLFSSVSMSA